MCIIYNLKYKLQSFKNKNKATTQNAIKMN